MGEYDFYILEVENEALRIFKTADEAYDFFYGTYVNDEETPFKIRGKMFGEEIGWY